MSISINKLPRKIYLDDYNGDYHSFIDAVYQVFYDDFIRNKSYFGGYELKMKWNPIFQDKAYTFYHMTHKGEVEQNRIPDLRRCERMPWAKPTTEKASEYKLKFWEQIRNNKHRICIWLNVEDGNDTDNYFVILEVRKDYVLLWTAFCGEYSNAVKKKEKEYLQWKQNQTRQYTPQELVQGIMDKLKEQESPE